MDVWLDGEVVVWLLIGVSETVLYLYSFLEEHLLKSLNGCSLRNELPAAAHNEIFKSLCGCSVRNNHGTNMDFLELLIVNTLKT